RAFSPAARSAAASRPGTFGAAPPEPGVAIRSGRKGEPMTAVGVRSPDWLAYHARCRPDSLAVVDLGTDRRFTYAELNDRAERLATVLSADFGIAAGDRVAIYSQ